MNAFAAQAVLAELKPPETDEMSPSVDRQVSLFGLPAFVTMSSVKRMSGFERILGGTKILSQVGAILDADWTLLQP